MRDPDPVSESSNGKGREHYLLWLIWVVWLPFLVPPISDLFQEDHGPVHLVVTLISLILFVSLYLWATWHNVQHLLDVTGYSKRASRRCWTLCHDAHR